MGSDYCEVLSGSNQEETELCVKQKYFVCMFPEIEIPTFVNDSCKNPAQSEYIHLATNGLVVVVMFLVVIIILGYFHH